MVTIWHRLDRFLARLRPHREPLSLLIDAGVVALAWAGYHFAGESWAINEHSNVTADGPPVYPFKTILPLAGAFLLVQGVVEIIRCVICLRQGYWPTRIEDVEEVDVDKLKEMVHVKDEDIAKLDVYVDGAKGNAK